MGLLYLSHTECLKHTMGSVHPESPARIIRIEKALNEHDWSTRITKASTTPIDIAQIARIHPAPYVQDLVNQTPETGWNKISDDINLNPFSVSAARHAAGAAAEATEAVLSNTHSRAFCAIRPPGHHAESTMAMGFCLFNNAAIAADYALSHGCERVAILDFDVHHANGTVEIFKDRPEVMVCSSFQYPFYPNRYDDVDRAHIILTPLAVGSASDTFKIEIERDWTPALLQHQPDLIIISAGFDAHEDDPMGGLKLQAADFRWVTDWIVNQAQRYCEGKIVSILEGGYRLSSLQDSAIAHIKGLTLS